jgi:hypothetical protein
MKGRNYFAVVTLVLIGLFAAAPAKAQSGNRVRLIANVPFEFEVGNVRLPAGEYQVREIVESSQGAVLQLRNRDCNASIALMTNSIDGKSQDRGRLIFHRYGNRYYFAEAWTSGNSSGLQARKSKAERATERELARLNHPMETIVLMARN